MRRCTFCFALGKSPEKLSASECPIAEQTEQTILLLFTKEYHIVHIVAGMRDIPEMQNQLISSLFGNAPTPGLYSTQSSSQNTKAILLYLQESL